MIEGRRGGTPHAAIVAVVVAAAVLLPLLIGDHDDAISNVIGAAELLGPVAFLLLPIALILIIHFLSGSFVAGIFSSSADRNSIHRVTASPLGVIMLLLLVLLLLYNKVSIFTGYDDSE